MKKDREKKIGIFGLKIAISFCADFYASIVSDVDGWDTCSASIALVSPSDFFCSWIFIQTKGCWPNQPLEKLKSWMSLKIWEVTIGQI